MKRINHKFLNGIESKRCSACKDWLPLGKFGKQKAKCSGLRAQCKKCRNSREKLQREANFEKIQEARQQWYKINSERIKEKSKYRYKIKKEEILAHNRVYRETHKKEHNASNIIYRKKHQEELNVRLRQRRKTDLKFRLNINMSKAIGRSLKNGKNGSSWLNAVDYTLDELKKYLTKTMPKGYTWQDYMLGKLHIDHKIPKVAFNFTKPEHKDFQRCWALKNLQLLPASKNMSKGSKLTKSFQPSLLI